MPKYTLIVEDGDRRGYGGSDDQDHLRRRSCRAGQDRRGYAGNDRRGYGGGGQDRRGYGGSYDQDHFRRRSGRAGQDRRGYYGGGQDRQGYVGDGSTSAAVKSAEGIAEK